MAKRTLAWLLCLAMLLSVVPVLSVGATAVSTDTPGASAYCNHSSHEGWTAWTSKTSLPTESGNYYLTEDVTLSAGWYPSNLDIHLCLNGKNITQTKSGSRVIGVLDGTKLYIYDCTASTDAAGNYIAGKLTGGAQNIGACINVNRGGLLHLYGGIITGNHQAGTNGGGVYLQAATSANKTAGMFNMYGGEISGNSCKNGAGVYVAGGVNESGYTNAVFNMYGGRIIGNSAGGDGGAIMAVAYGTVNITDGIIAGNTTAAGAAVSITDNAKLTVSGDVVIANNTNAANTADVVVADKLYVNELTGGSNITVQTTADQTDANKVIAVNGKQTASWQAGWVTYMKLDGTTQDMGYITSGSGKTFAFGHYHGDQKYTAYNGGASHNLMKTGAGYYYLTADILRNTNSSAHLSLDTGGTVQHLCLNGHSFTHRNPAIRLYYLNTGDNLTIEDCTSYRDDKGQFVAGTITYAGASDSTIEDGSMMQVDAGATVTLENIKITGFHSTKSAVLRVLGTAESRGTLNLNNVEISGNSNDGNSGVLYASTGATVNMTDCVINDNTAKNISAIGSAGDAQITLTDTVITGNTANAYGACNVANPNIVFKLVGATRVIDNQGGNLHLQKGAGYVYNLDGLTEGAKVGITLIKARIAEGQLHFSTVVAEGKDPKPYCVSDDDAYRVVLNDEGRLALTDEEEPVEPSDTHSHVVCGGNGCTDHGEAVTFQPWDDPSKLPETSGNYYLTTDVKITNRAGLTGVDVKLCLNGHTITPADSYADSRAFYFRSTAKLVLTDCDKTPGKISGFTNTPLMFDKSCTDAALSIYNIEVSGNTNTKTGSAVILQGTGVFNLYSGRITGNTTTASGTVYAAGNVTLNLLGGEISDNTAGTTAGGLHLEDGKLVVNLTGTRITGNTAGTMGGGIYVKKQLSQLNISGDAQVTGNTVNGKENNLYLSGTTVFTPGKLSAGKTVGITAENSGRAISTTLTQDVSAGYVSDDEERTVSYQNSTLVIDERVKHNHCACNGDAAGCDHKEIKFQPWESTTSLPASGNWFLTGDVTIKYRAGLQSTTLNLCLNGYTIKADDSYTEKSRAFYLYGDSKLTITDCTEQPGKITNFKSAAIMADGTCVGARIDLHHVQIVGNENNSTVSGGAIVLQGTSELNFYSGTISGNYSINHAGAIYVGGKSAANLMGGEITGNTAEKNCGAVMIDNANARVNLSGTKISGNTAANGGAFLIQNRGHLNMTGGEISGNRATENGGGVYIATNSSMVMSGGKITGNTSDKYTAAISVQTGAKLTLSGDAQITGNEAMGTYGGIYVHKSNGGVSISGNVVVSGNVCKDQPTNLYLAGESKFTAGKLGEKGNVGISTGAYFRAVSNEVGEDVSAGYFSDSKSLAVTYQDNALFLGAPDGHSHCFCAADDNHCDHAQVKFAPWDNAASLPTSGNWYLTTDVLISNRAGLENTTLNLCLNGHTVKVKEGQSRGRAIYVYGDTKLTLTDCNETPGMFTGANETAVMFDGTCVGAELNLWNVTFTGNSTTNAGGAILVQGETVFNMYSGTIKGNTAKSILKVDDEGNPVLDSKGNQQLKSKTGGGGVAVVGKEAVFNMYGGTITGNKTIKGSYLYSGKTTSGGGHGGGVYCAANMNMYGGTVSGNSAGGNGGGIMFTRDDTVFHMEGGTVSGNSASAGGGIILQNRTVLYLKGGAVRSNSAKTAGGIYISSNAQLKMSGGSVTGNTASSSCGGIYLNRSIATLSGGSVSYNTSKGNAGGIYLSGATAYLYGTYIGNNTAKKNGGGIVTGQAKATVNGVEQKFQCTLVLSGSTVAGNKGVNGGGILLQSYTKFTMSSGAIRDNVSTSAGGGAYVSTNADVKMTGGSVTGNTAKTHGGAWYHNQSTGSYTGGTISGNTAVKNGGVFAVNGDKAEINVKGYDLSGVTAVNGGVALCQNKATLNMEDCKFYNNSVTSGGGTVYISDRSFGSLTNCKFYNNQAAKQGGAVFAARNTDVSITNCVFTENTAGTDGGAILCRGNVRLTNCQVADNSATGNGGGIATGKCGIRGSKFQEGLVLTNVTVTDNISGGKGGGLYLSTGCRTTMTDVSITGNEAFMEGGAYWAVDDTTLHNVTATGNKSGGEGYAAWYDYSIFDGHSYFVGVHKITGDIIIKDNQGGDVYLGQEVAMAIGLEGLGQETEFNIELDAGVLTNRLYGEYNYEGGNRAYTVTYGSRSLTEPEVDEAMTQDETQQDQQTQETKKADVLLYVGIGAVALILIAVCVIFVMKKKKAGAPAEKANKE